MVKRNFPKIDNEAFNISYKTYVWSCEVLHAGLESIYSEGYSDSGEGTIKGTKVGQRFKEEELCRTIEVTKFEHS